MSALRIVLGDEFAFSSDLTSPIWVEIDGIAFPGEDWDDFSYTLLSRWSDALLSYTNSSAGFRWDFMDGPYEIDIRRKGDLLALSCLRDDRCQLESECSFDELAKALYRGLKQMGYLLHENGLDEGSTAWIAEDIRARTSRMRELIQ